MRLSRSSRQILLLDCCYAGAFERGMLLRADEEIHTGEYFEQGRGRVLITASDAMQYSFEEDNLKGQGQRSIFTSALIEGLRTGNADLDHDGRITYDELYDYTLDRVRAETPYQTPGKWVFALKGAR